jgi:hypothetical protein
MYLYIHIYKNIYIFIGVYNTSKHPDVINGRKTSQQVLREFLDGFDVGGVVDGKLLMMMMMFT